jgi:hypothetical protein
MIHIYFKDDLDPRQLQEIWNWAWSVWGWQVREEDRTWGWISTEVKTNPVGDRQVIGMKLPDKEAVALFKLKFPYETYGMFETIEVVEYGSNSKAL